MLFGDAGALPDATIKALPQGFWSSFGYVSHDTMAKFPNSLLTITLASNFGTFLLYMLSCVTCIFCYKGHPNYSFVRHTLIPYFGIAANLICMAAYIVLPFMGYGTKMEPFLALGRSGGRFMEGFTSCGPAKPLGAQHLSPAALSGGKYPSRFVRGRVSLRPPSRRDPRESSSQRTSGLRFRHR